MNTFEQKMKVIESNEELVRLKHKLKMEELLFERNSMKILHEQILERERIKRAEEKKMLRARSLIR